MVENTLMHKHLPLLYKGLMHSIRNIRVFILVFVLLFGAVNTVFHVINLNVQYLIFCNHRGCLSSYSHFSVDWLSWVYMTKLMCIIFFCYMSFFIHAGLTFTWFLHEGLSGSLLNALSFVKIHFSNYILKATHIHASFLILRYYYKTFYFSSTFE